MELTIEQVRKVAPRMDGAQMAEFVRIFNAWNDAFQITTPLRIAHFLATVWHESSGLTRLTENLNYSAQGLRRTFARYFPTVTLANQYARKPQAIANRVYANRMGNGNEASGDGWRYRGRGLIQLTGRANYAAYQQSGFCNGDLLSHPEWLAQYPGALKSAMWFWWKSGCNALADRDDATAVCRRVNGGTNGLDDRKAWLVRWKGAINQ